MPRYGGPMYVAALLLLYAMSSHVAYAEDLYHERSLYRDIVVYEEDGLRCMRFGLHNAARQSCIRLKSPDALVFNYTKMMLGALYLKPNPKRILVIGLGGGMLPSAFQKMFPDAAIDCVEIDQAVVNVAKRFFQFVPSKKMNVYVQDGRVFVRRAIKNQVEPYDLIVLDAFDNAYIPEHMLTREFLREVRNLLKADGVLTANTFSSSRLYPFESATYFDVFGGYFNLQLNSRVIIARKDGLPTLDEVKENCDSADLKIRLFGTGKEWLLPLFTRVASKPSDARVLTDQYSPANLLNSGG